jgi:cell wall assembly regulator SMI1
MKDIGMLWDEGPGEISTIEQAERLIGYRFPNEYKQLMVLHDQLTPKLNFFKFINIYGKKDERDITFFGYKENSEKLLDSQDFDVYGYDEIVAIGSSGNGDYICLDYRHDPKTNEPQVVLMYHDDFVIDHEGNRKMAINFVAPNFAAFVDILYESEFMKKM